MIVVLESPYKGTAEQLRKVFNELPARYMHLQDEIKMGISEDIVFEINIDYATYCLQDSLLRNESPFASHVLYTNALIDNKPEERKLGIEAGHKFIDVCDFMVVYIDHGISEGMKQGIAKAEKLGKRIEYRRIYDV